MKKFYPVRIIQTRETVVAIEGESLEDVKKKCEAESVVGRVLKENHCNNVSISLYCAGVCGTIEEVGEKYVCFNDQLKRVQVKKKKEEA